MKCDSDTTYTCFSEYINNKSQIKYLNLLQCFLVGIELTTSILDMNVYDRSLGYIIN